MQDYEIAIIDRHLCELNARDMRRIFQDEIDSGKLVIGWIPEREIITVNGAGFEKPEHAFHEALGYIIPGQESDAWKTAHETLVEKSNNHESDYV